MQTFITALSCLGAFCYGGHSAVAQKAKTDAEIVDGFYPQHLAVDATGQAAIGGPARDRLSSFVLADLDRSGKRNYIVAAYSNGSVGVVRVIRKNGSSATLVDEADVKGNGSYAHLRLLDLERDGRPEVIVSWLSQGRASVEWILKWNGSSLLSIGPAKGSSSGIVHSLTINAEYVDIDRDGDLDLAVPATLIESADDTSVAVFTLDGGKYGTERLIPFLELMYCDSVEGEPVPCKEMRDFGVKAPGGGYTLRVFSDAARGSVRTGTIKLNGVEVITSKEFEMPSLNIAREVTLAATNSLEVEVLGKKGCEVAVVIDREH